MEQDRKQEAPKDRSLDVPAEAARDRHVNFLADENDNDSGPDREVAQRRKQWQEGLEAGRRAAGGASGGGQRDDAASERD